MLYVRPRCPRSVKAALVALALLAGAASVPLALAQEQLGSTTLAINIVDPARALQPGATEVLILSPVVYRVPQSAAGEPDPTNTQNFTRPTRITFSVVEKPDWVLDAQVVPSELLVIPPNQFDGRTSVELLGLVVLLNVSPDAGAQSRQSLVVEGTAEQNGQIPARTQRSSEMPLRVALVADLEVTSPLASPFVLKGGEWTKVPFEVRNLGNDDLTVVLNVTLKPELSEVRLPKELQVVIPRNGTHLVEIEIRTPWTERERGTLELEATPLLEASEGKAERHALEVEGASAAPGPGLLPVALLLAGLAVAYRRRWRR